MDTQNRNLKKQIKSSELESILIIQVGSTECVENSIKHLRRGGGGGQVVRIYVREGEGVK